MIIILTSGTDNEQYEKNISLLKNNLENDFSDILNNESLKKSSGIFGDFNFNSYDLRREKDNHKQQDFYKVILTLTNN